MVSHKSCMTPKSRETVKYGHESCRTQNQECAGKGQHQFTRPNQKNKIMGPVDSRCQQQFTRLTKKISSEELNLSSHNY
jgi:hypothetical protein